MARTRKPWYDLTEAYRNRLEKGGIGPEEYRRGDSLQKARGHKPKEHKTRKSSGKVKAPKVQGVSEGSYRYWKRGAAAMGITGDDWERGVKEFDWEDLKDLLRWKVKANRLRNQGYSLGNGIPDPPRAIKYNKHDIWFFYGDL